MKFLRDLKLLNETWYKRYLVSRTSDTGLNVVSDFADDEDKDQDDRHDFQFRPSNDDEFDFDSYNDLLAAKDSQSDMSEQRRRVYL